MALEIGALCGAADRAIEIAGLVGIGDQVNIDVKSRVIHPFAHVTRRREILDRKSDRVEDGDVLRISTSGLLTRYDFPYLCDRAILCKLLALPIDELAPIRNEIVFPKTSSGVFNSTNIDYVHPPRLAKTCSELDPCDLESTVSPNTKGPSVSRPPSHHCHQLPSAPRQACNACAGS